MFANGARVNGKHRGHSFLAKPKGLILKENFYPGVSLWRGVENDFSFAGLFRIAHSCFQKFNLSFLQKDAADWRIIR